MRHTLVRIVGRLAVLALVIVAALPILPAQAAEPASPVQQEIGTNLLTNPGFEGIGKPIDNPSPNPGNWTRDTHTGVPYGEIFTPEGWVTWWQEGDFKRPECHVIARVEPFLNPIRIYQGYYSVKCFAFYGMMNAGVYQVVRNIPPGSRVQGAFHAHAWSCNESTAEALSCGDPSAFWFRVGIDPNGGTDPWSGNIVWSAPYFHYDNFGRVGPVEATVGPAGAATLFLQAYAKWPLQHNDAYMDSASLTLVSTGTPPTETPPPPPPTPDAPAATATPRPIPTERPDGAVVHTVVAGDTLFGLALEYGVSVDQIYELNNLGPQSILSIGQEIVISVSGGAAAPVPTATPEPDDADEPAPEETQPIVIPVAPEGDQATLCVLAFHDANADSFRQGDEALLPNAQITLLGTSGPVAERTTDGVSEPWCFDDIEPGQYILRHSAPPGYEETDGGQWNVVLAAGQTTTVELAYVRDGSTVEDPDAQPTEVPAGDENGGGVTSVLNIILRVSGIFVLLLAVAVLVLFVLSRRAA